MEYGHELYAERLRREAQAEALATGAAQWTDKLSPEVRAKLRLAWRQHTVGFGSGQGLSGKIKTRTLHYVGEILGAVVDGGR